MSNVATLYETLAIFDRGHYEKSGRRVALDADLGRKREAWVLLPDDVERVGHDPAFAPERRPGTRCQYRCENRDSLEMAMDWPDDGAHSVGGPVLVLNFANPVHPGGGVRRGARAQEEDLCRRSSLLLSLEGEQARSYYEYNRGLRTHLGSDAIVMSRVEVIRAADGRLLDRPYGCDVMTCAAPVAGSGGGISELEYEGLLLHRIEGMLRVAARTGHRRLVLGAWGCGAFGNDARVMSDLFFRSLRELDYNGRGQSDLFDSVDFAVLDCSRDRYNLREFERNFTQENFYRDEPRVRGDVARGDGAPSPSGDDRSFLVAIAESGTVDVSDMARLVLTDDVEAFVRLLDSATDESPARMADDDFRRVAVAGLERGVALGDGACANHLGALYYLGDAVPQDYRRARELYELADAKGVMQGTVNLGYIYEYGRCGEPDYDAAYRQYAKAAAISGHFEALYKLGDMYARGRVGAADPRTAFALYERSLGAAEGLAAQAQPAFRIAQLVSDPSNVEWGIPYDPMGALGLFQLAERGLRIDIAHGQTYYRERLQRAIEGQERMRLILDEPGSRA